MDNQLVFFSGGRAVTSTLIIAEGTQNEHRAVLQLLRNYLADFEHFGRVTFEMQPFKTAGGTQKREIALLTEPQATLLLTYMRNNDIVRDFKKRLVEAFFELLNQVKTPPLTPQPISANPTPLEVEIAVFHAAAQTLRVSDTSKIRMLSVICSQNGGNPQFLPQYVDETLTRAITSLLKERDHQLASKVAKIVNPALQAMGYLERLSRKSTKTGIKEFWSLTDTGLEYGRNETSPNNPRETQPMYYVDRFDELLEQIENYLYQRAIESDHDVM